MATEPCLRHRTIRRPNGARGASPSEESGSATYRPSAVHTSCTHPPRATIQRRQSLANRIRLPRKPNTPTEDAQCLRKSPSPRPTSATCPNLVAHPPLNSSGQRSRTNREGGERTMIHLAPLLRTLVLRLPIVAGARAGVACPGHLAVLRWGRGLAPFRFLVHQGLSISHDGRMAPIETPFPPTQHSLSRVVPRVVRSWCSAARARRTGLRGWRGIRGGLSRLEVGYQR